MNFNLSTDLTVYLHRAWSAVRLAGQPRGADGAQAAPPQQPRQVGPPYQWDRQQRALRRARGSTAAWEARCSDPKGWWLPQTAQFEGITWPSGDRQGRPEARDA